MSATKATGAPEGLMISTVAKEGLRVTHNGKPVRLAVIDDDGQVLADGKDLARNAAASAIDWYRQMLVSTGCMQQLSRPLKANGHA